MVSRDSTIVEKIVEKQSVIISIHKASIYQSVKVFSD